MSSPGDLRGGPTAGYPAGLPLLRDLGGPAPLHRRCLPRACPGDSQQGPPTGNRLLFTTSGNLGEGRLGNSQYNDYDKLDRRFYWLLIVLFIAEWSGWRTAKMAPPAQYPGAGVPLEAAPWAGAALALSPPALTAPHASHPQLSTLPHRDLFLLNLL